MKALTVTDTSSGSWVSDSAVCTTWEYKVNEKRFIEELKSSAELLEGYCVYTVPDQ